MKMNNVDSIYFFIFVFTTLVFLRNINKVVRTLVQKEIKPLTFSTRELITLGLSISYIITYLIKG